MDLVFVHGLKLLPYLSAHSHYTYCMLYTPDLDLLDDVTQWTKKPSGPIPDDTNDRRLLLT